MMPEAKPAMSPAPPDAPSCHEGSPCPNCGSASVHRSHRKGFTERLLVLVGARIRRCHACTVRFARLFNSAVYIDDARSVLRRVALLVLMIAGAALVLAIILWLMHKQAQIGPSEGLLEPPAHASCPVPPPVPPA